MIRKYHNHKMQTTPWHREEEPLNHHETPGRQIKQSNQLSLPRTLFFITPGRWQSKTLILSTNADQKSIKQGFLLSFVARLAIVNTVSCDYYPRSSIVKSVFNRCLPGMFNLNTARALCIARCCFVFTTPAKRTIIATSGIRNEKSGVWDRVHK